MIYGNLVDIHLKQIYPASIEISDDGLITKIQKDVSLMAVSFEKAKKIPYILCGFIDSHVNVESSLLTPSEFARIALSQGVIGAVTDFHEIVHILGSQGFDLLRQNTDTLPFYFSIGAPSKEISGLYTLNDIENLLKRADISHLGEIKDFPAVLLGDEKELLKISYAKKELKPIDGYAPGLSKEHIKTYASSGISTDHRCISMHDAEEKIAAGLKIQLSLNSSTETGKEYSPLFTAFENSVMFCSDTESCFTMVKGYIRNAVKSAVNNGTDIFSVIRAASMNPILHYGMKTGLLREGDSADFIMVNNLEEFLVLNVYVKGTCVYSHENGTAFPAAFKENMIPRNDFCALPIHEDNILLRSSKIAAKVHVICCYDGEANTMHKKVVMAAHGGYISSLPEIDCIKLMYYSRYGEFQPVIAFVHGFGLKEGALAMSVSHDEHNIIALGICDSDIVRAVNRVVALQGGIVFVNNGEIIAELALPLAGIISLEPAEQVIEKIGKIKNALFVYGCPLEKPITTLSNLTDSSVPLLKITRAGLFDVVSQEILPVLCED